jgi:hypothetical protein
VLYLLDADTLIRADSTYYSLKRFPVFWQWLKFNGVKDNLKIPLEQYEEIVAGTGELVEWLTTDDTKTALLLAEDVDPDLVAKVIAGGYAADLDEAEIEKIGRDPFLDCIRMRGRECALHRHVRSVSPQQTTSKSKNSGHLQDVRVSLHHAL